MIDIYKQKSVEKIILITPALFNEELWNKDKFAEVQKGYTRSNEDFVKYAEALEQIGSELKLPVVNLNKAFKKYADEKLDGKWQDLLCDGLHFSGNGYYVFYNELVNTINKNYPEMSVAQVEYNLPNWRNVKSDASNLNL